MTKPAGITIWESKFKVQDIVDRIQHFLEEKGITVYLRIDQKKEAGKVGIKLPPLQIMMFGNPEVGGVVMAGIKPETGY